MTTRPDPGVSHGAAPAPNTTWRGAPRPGPWANERWVWAAALFAGALDVLLTLYGLGLGFVEANPVAAAVLASVGPVPGLVGLKAAAVAAVAVGSRVVPPEVRPSPAALLAVTWSGAALYNCWVLLS